MAGIPKKIRSDPAIRPSERIIQGKKFSNQTVTERSRHHTSQEESLIHNPLRETHEYQHEYHPPKSTVQTVSGEEKAPETLLNKRHTHGEEEISRRSGKERGKGMIPGYKTTSAGHTKNVPTRKRTSAIPARLQLRKLFTIHTSESTKRGKKQGHGSRLRGAWKHYSARILQIKGSRMQNVFKCHRGLDRFQR